MIPVFSIEQMRSVDRHLIEKIGLPSLVLMENAAHGILQELNDKLEDKDSTILIYWGPGNNGGDGLALTRLLIERGHQKVYLTKPPGKLSEDCAMQLSVVQSLLDADHFVGLDYVGSLRVDIAVDALLGTGAKPEIIGDLAARVDSLNTLAQDPRVFVVAIDLPTGLNGDTGKCDKATTVKAARTVTIGAPKLGFYQGEARSMLGELCIAGLGYPITAVPIKGPRSFLAERADISTRIPRANDQASKFSNGRVFALAGSRGMTGAAIMCATSALRSGCGLVNVALPRSERSLVAQAMPELLTVGCAETDEGYPSLEGYGELEPHMEHADVILVGPGLRKAEGVTELMLKIITEIDKPMVIDAGALGALAGNTDLLKQRTAATIITPHSGELSRLNGVEWDVVEEDRWRYAREFAIEHKVIVISKGAPTYTIDIDGTAYINSTGNAGLATAGSGDVLAGVVAGTFVQMQEDPLGASILGAYIHGLAGDLAAEELTQTAMTAMDVQRYLPNAYKSLGCK